MDSDDFILFGLIGAVVIIGFVVIAIAAMSPEDPIPMNCGITKENHSESYMMSTGKTVTIHYYHDLVCTNGTTIFEWEK